MGRKYPPVSERFERDRGCVAVLLGASTDDCRGRLTADHVKPAADGRLHPDDGYSYEECNGPSCRAIRGRADPVEPR